MDNGTTKPSDVLTVDWDKTMQVGKSGEETVLIWIGGIPNSDDVLTRFEVKNSWHGGDICIEEDSVVEQGKKGWIYTMRAHSVIFLDQKKGEAIIIEADELRLGYEEYKDYWKKMGVPFEKLLTAQTSKRGDGSTWTSTHVYVPLHHFFYAHLTLRNLEKKKKP